jgi:molybdopterin synthase catalytic subunit
MVPGENIVLVLTAAAHRQAALDSTAFLIDWLKTKAPFWKREELPDGIPKSYINPLIQDKTGPETLEI